MPLSDAVRLQHLLRAANDALRLVAGRTRPDLDTDVMLLLALVKCLEIIGEAAANVSPATRAQISGVPWGQIVRMRNILIHEYFAIDADIVWSTVTSDLPSLVAAVAPHA
jgi:uncharacterized protein with HEPN domain